jgi:hypothetical protein
MNAGTGQPVPGFDPLLDGAALNLGTLPTRNLNIKATTQPATVGSVRFGYDANPSFQMENSAPYALARASTTVWNPWTPTVGNHTVTATPYSLSNGSGSSGTALTIRFSCVDDPSTKSSNGLLLEATAVAEDGESADLSSEPGNPGGSCGLLGLEAALVVAYFALRPRSSRASA